MKLLTSPGQIDQLFTQLISQYSYFDWLSAWAGITFNSFQKFNEFQHKCRRVVIGTHFFQTHPNFISSVIDNKGVRFIKNTTELFHPKGYLFFNNESDWQLLIGSANFTRGAFSTNIETMLCVSSADSDSSTILIQFRKMVQQCWDLGTTFSQPELQRYRTAWQNMRSKHNALSQWSDESQKPKIESAPLLKAKTFTMSWPSYVKIVTAARSDLDLRLEFLEEVGELFKTYRSLVEMPEEARKYIAGTKNSYQSKFFHRTLPYPIWKAFGNMSGYGIYAGKIKDNDERISQALDYIPLEGSVVENDFSRFINTYIECFGGNPIATATRLLAMKRPDVFYCFTKANSNGFCEDFQITKSHVSVRSYWDMVIERVQNCEWWQHPQPGNEQERRIRSARAALLDSVYYKR